MMITPRKEKDTELVEEEVKSKSIRVQLTETSVDNDPYRPFDEPRSVVANPLWQTITNLVPSIPVYAAEQKGESLEDEPNDEAALSPSKNFLSPIKTVAMGVLSPIMSSKKSPKTPATCGTDGSPTRDDLMKMMEDGIMLPRSDLNQRFDSEDRKKRRYIFCNRWYLKCVLALLVFALVVVCALIYGMAQQEQVEISQEVGAFYKVKTGDDMIIDDANLEDDLYYDDDQE
jgi:hypothetical protein